MFSTFIQRRWKLISFRLILILETLLFTNLLWLWHDRRDQLKHKRLLQLFFAIYEKNAKEACFLPFDTVSLYRMKTPISTQTSCHLLFSMPQIVLDVRVEWLYWNSIEWYSNSCLFVNSLNQHQFWNWTSEEKICPRFKVPRVKNLTR
jgi:hypothetical protein